MRVRLLLAVVLFFALASLLVWCAAAGSPVSGWFQINISGFGDPTHDQWVMSLATFGDRLFAGTAWTGGSPNSGAQIWAYDGGLSWTNVVTAGFGDINNVWVSTLAAYGSDLYAGTYYDGRKGAQIWRTSNGTDWTNVITAGFGLPLSNLEIMHLVPYGGDLYATTGQYYNYMYDPVLRQIGAQAYRYDGSSWTNVITAGFGYTTNQAIIGLAGSNSYLYAGTWTNELVTPPAAAQIWRSPSGDSGSWTAIMTDGFGTTNTIGIPGLAYFNNYLYAGTRNGVTGCEIWRTLEDPIAWTNVVTHGDFGPGANASNYWVDSLTIYNNAMYAAVRNGNTGVEVYSTTNGLNWSPVTLDGWGDSLNIKTSDGNDGGAVDIFRGALTYGTYNKGISTPLGGEVWQFISSSTTVTSTPNPSVFGDPVTFTVAVTSDVGTPTGVISLKIDSATLTETLDASGQATYVTSTLSVGSHPITATYAGAATFPGSAVTGTQVVSQAASVTALTSTPNPSAFGQDVTFTATVTATVGTPTGVVTFTLDTTAVTATLDAGGQATYVTSTLPVGSHPVTATYGGDLNFAGSTDSGTQVVSQAASVTALTSTPNPSAFGQDVTVTATVTATVGTPTGVVTFTLDTTAVTATLDAGGQATYVTSTLPVGSHPVTATYGGDLSFAGSTDSGTQVVSQAASVTALTSTPNPSAFGQDVTFTATVTATVGTPTGVVTFTLDTTAVTATLDAGGQATYVTSTLPVGSHPVTATYGGDLNFAGSSDSGTQVVSQAASVTALTSTPNPSAFGQDVTFTATVTATVGTPTGVVTFTLDTTAVTATLDAGGQATYVTSTLPVGSHPVTATYGGDLNFAGSSDSGTQVVSQAASVTALTSTPNPSAFGQNVTLTATVTSTLGTPTGVVTFTLDTTAVTATLDAGGQATYVTSTLPVGSHPVTATYGGDLNFAGSSDSGTQVVSQAASVTALTSAPNPSAFGQDVTFTATVTATLGTPTGVVTFTLDTTAVTGTLDAGGQATYVTSTLPVGSHPVTATYGGDLSFAGSSDSGTQVVSQAASVTALTSTPNPSAFGQDVTFTATVTSTLGTPTGVVTFTLDTTEVTGTLDAGGQATYVTSTLPVGSHPVTATYGGDLSFAGSSDSGTQVVSQAASVTALTSTPNPSAFGQDVTFTATVTATLGTPTGVVTFTLDTTAVTGTLDAGGQATYVTSTLPVGSHPMTATYGGDLSFAGSSDSGTQVVGQAASVTALTSTPNPSAFGQDVTFTATVTSTLGTPTGVVTFTLDTTAVTGTLDAGGQATYVTSTLPVGSHPVTATYGGDLSFADSSDSGTQVVNESHSELVASKSASPDPVQSGATITYDLRVTNTGSVDLHVVITDILPAMVTSPGPVTWGPIVIQPGDVFTAQITGTVIDYIGTLTNVLVARADDGATTVITATSQAIFTPFSAVLQVNRFDDVYRVPLANQCRVPTSTDCSLREAIGLANLSRPTHITILLPTGTYTLTLPETSGPDPNAGGDLNIEGNMTILGGG